MVSHFIYNNATKHSTPQNLNLTYTASESVSFSPFPDESSLSLSLQNVLDTLSVKFSCLVVYDSLWLHGLRHTRLPCPSPTPRTSSNSRPSSQWCHPTLYFNLLLIPFSRSTKVLILFELYSHLKYNLILMFLKLFLTISFHGDICVIWHPIVLSN